MAGFLVLAVVLAVLGGYQLSQLFHEVDVSSAKRSVQLLEIEERLDDAAIGLGRQVQEWKDMLLRVHNSVQHAQHQQGFKEASIAVQHALLAARTNMLDIGMDTTDIDGLIAEHKSLLSEYLQAYSDLRSAEAGSGSRVDKQVLGVDRKLQARIVQVKSAISEYAKLQLARAPQTQGSRNVMVGLIGTISLFMMAVLGFAYARRMRAG
ncbi:MAG: hypothetical protein PHP05_09795 [Sideroxydans sp.]|nr:hypothetical protein [Sideroxydans sp.]